MKKYNWKSLMRSSARKIWLWSPMRKEAIRNARVAPGVVGCAECSKHMKESAKPKGYDVDHKVPASEPAERIHSWDNFFERLMVPAEPGLQVLCKQCHSEKTLKENTIRKRSQRKAKRKKSKVRNSKRSAR